MAEFIVQYFYLGSALVSNRSNPFASVNTLHNERRECVFYTRSNRFSRACAAGLTIALSRGRWRPEMSEHKERSGHGNRHTRSSNTIRQNILLERNFLVDLDLLSLLLKTKKPRLLRFWS